MWYMSITRDNDSMPECVGMDCQPMTDTNTSVSDAADDAVDVSLCDSSVVCWPKDKSSQEHRTIVVANSLEIGMYLFP